MFIYILRDIVAVLFIIFLTGFLSFISAMKWIKQLRGKHKQVFENRACNVICAKRRKDLGFIDKRREQHDAKS